MDHHWNDSGLRIGTRPTLSLDPLGSGPTPLSSWGRRADNAGVSSTDLDATTLESRTAVFSALSDPIRLRILDSLSAEQRCVCEIQEHIPDIAPNLLSYHLRVLREAGLVESTRRGRWVDYRLVHDADQTLVTALPAGLMQEEGAW